MPCGLDVDRLADAAGVSSTANTIDVSITVKLVGVVGSSACGKSTLAHQLASRLNSPLYPISTDSFFLDDVCAELGTYEDYRCIDYGAVARWMSALVHAVPRVSVSPPKDSNPSARSPGILGSSTDSGATLFRSRHFEASVQDAWWSHMRLHLTELSRYRRLTAEPAIRTSALATDSIVASAAASASPAPNGALSTEAILARAPQNDGVSDNSSDVSLCAHETEEEDRRRRSVTASTKRQQDDDSTTAYSFLGLRGGADEEAPHAVFPVSHHVIIYVVWEGITLLCNRSVNSFIDYGIAVECDLETACLRRFFRSPRRHLVQRVIDGLAEGYGDTPQDEAHWRQRREQASVLARIVRQVYRPRIEKLWSTRSRERYRAELGIALEQEMRLDGLDAFAGVNCSTPTSSSACFTLRDALHLLSPSCFDPPRPHCLYRPVHAGLRNAMADIDTGTTSPLPAGHCDATDAQLAISVTTASSSVTAGQIGEYSSTCWSPDGLPTAAFQIFWEREFDDWLKQSSSSSSPAPIGAAALGWASLTHNGTRDISRSTAQPVDQQQRRDLSGGLGAASPPQWSAFFDDSGVAYVNRILEERVRLILLQSSPRGERAVEPSCAEAPSTSGIVSPAENAGHELPLAAGSGHNYTAVSAETIASALAPFYYEFRYWFFFEVLYYDQVHRPLQAHRLQWRSVLGGEHCASPNRREGSCGVGDGCGITGALRDLPRPWWTIANGRGVHEMNTDGFIDQIEAISVAIRAIR
ncbi:hypothetical protein JKF63_05262 [Porcisia hertigi]|uniref:Uncharacterized protein n=1 Tax=Porcisia hertigi TaxID=2761500 RepID=A0A836IFZ7_9TRYP|nr:hypothetical protein JKF63_05262 [Porcisia hertigi]